MLLSMLCLSSVWALMPLTSIAFPTGSNERGTSNTVLDQLFGRDQAPRARTAESIAYVKPANTTLVPTSIDPTDLTPIYTFPSNKSKVTTDIFGNPIASAGSHPGGGPSSIINFKWGFGPVIIDGRIDTDTLDTDITVWIYGLKLGEFHGNLVTGVAIDINLRFVKGEIKVYLKGTEVWLHLSLEFSFGKKLQKDVKILTLPDLGVPNMPHSLVKGTSQGGLAITPDATATS